MVGLLSHPVAVIPASLLGLWGFCRPVLLAAIPSGVPTHPQPTNE